MSVGFVGLVIGSIEYKEKSKIVELYTPYGKENVLARGASKVTSGLLGFTTTLNYVNFEKSKASFPVMIEYSLIKSYYFVLDSIKKANVVSIMIHIIKSLDDNMPHHRIFPFVINCLDLLEKEDPNYVLSVFLIKMLSIFGVQRAFKSCINCGKEEFVSFSIEAGGILCSNCSIHNENLYKLAEWMKYIYYDKTYICNKDIDYKFLLDFVYDYYYRHVHLKINRYK